MFVKNEEYPYQVVLEDHEKREKLEMWKWCCSTWGKPTYSNPLCWKNADDEYGYRFIFKLEEDQALFLLRWA